MKTICIDGNIACGKSTFINNLPKRSDIHSFLEPVQEWTNFKTFDNNYINLLDLAYNEPNKYSFLLQLEIQRTLRPIHKIDAPIKIIERSLLSSKYIFSKALYDNKNITSDEYSFLLKQNTDFYNESKPIDTIIYLRTDPKIAFARLSKRSRKEETNVSFSYIEQLHNLYESFMETIPSDKKIVVDYNVDLDDIDFSQFSI